MPKIIYTETYTRTAAINVSQRLFDQIVDADDETAQKSGIALVMPDIVTALANTDMELKDSAVVDVNNNVLWDANI